MELKNINIDREKLKKLRELKNFRKKPEEINNKLGDKISDSVTNSIGSWQFIVIQSIILCFWIAVNITAYIQRWDPYPFILLNLVLSFQAAYTSPIIMMSQNRQAFVDRQKAEEDYYINLKAEMEIELLHYKIDNLTQIIEELRQNSIKSHESSK